MKLRTRSIHFARENTARGAATGWQSLATFGNLFSPISTNSRIYQTRSRIWPTWRVRYTQGNRIQITAILQFFPSYTILSATLSRPRRRSEWRARSRIYSARSLKRAWKSSSTHLFAGGFTANKLVLWSSEVSESLHSICIISEGVGNVS